MEKSKVERMLGVLWLVVTGLSHVTKKEKWFLYEMLFAGEIHPPPTTKEKNRKR